MVFNSSKNFMKSSKKTSKNVKNKKTLIRKHKNMIGSGTAECKKGSDENNKYIYCLQKQNGDNIIILAIPRKDTIVQNLIKKYNLESNIKESPDNLK